MRDLKCLSCGKTGELKEVRLHIKNTFCESTETQSYCPHCYDRRLFYVEGHMFFKGKGTFEIKDVLYHKDGSMFRTVGGKEHFDYILRKEYYDVLDTMGWDKEDEDYYDNDFESLDLLMEMND